MVVFFNIDTQRDFMRRTGTLYVKEAEKIIPNLKRLTEFAVKEKIHIINTLDEHGHDDKEFIRNGGKFPEHCMRFTKGAENIFHTDLNNYNPRTTFTIIPKNQFDMFSNPNTEQIIKSVGDAVVYGVATDYCVKFAVLGLLKCNKRVFVVIDAIKGVEEKSTLQAIREMEDAGAVFLTTREVLDNE